MRGAALVLAGMLAAVPAGAVEISLKSHGGDAWTFAKRLEATVSGGRCDDVRFESPIGRAVAGADLAAVVPLREGANHVRAVCRKGGRDVAASAPQTWTVRLADRPVARIGIVADGDAVVLDAGGSESSEARAVPLVSYAWSGRADNPALAGALGHGSRLVLPTPVVDGDYHFVLKVTDTAGVADESTLALRVRDGMAVPVDPGERPAWVDKAVVYGVVPWLFGPRGLADVTARIDDIAATGATVLWLSPITDFAADDFGYAVTDHFRIRPSLGTDDDLKGLVAAAHGRGLRVVMDFVPNHVAADHPYYRDFEARGAASPYADWFQRDGNGQPVSYFHWTHLKNLNYDNAEVRRMMIAAFSQWVRDFNIDGFRVDAAWGVRERAPDFWREWRAELKRIDPDLLLLAETSARDPWYVDNGFDAAYDWGEGLGEWAWRDVFAEGRADLDKLREALAANDGKTPTLRFLNNNDTGARFVQRHGMGMAQAAAAMLFTLPGLPLIYTGDELAAAFDPYDEGPPLDWSEAPLRDHYRRLAELRQEVPALRSPELEPVHTDRDDTVLAYRRQDLVVLVNFSADEVRVAVEDAPQTARDLWSGEIVTPPEITLPPHGARVLGPAR